MKCQECNAMIINKVFCHESGCPNEKKTFVNGEWIQFVKCFECGYEVEEGTICECQNFEDDNDLDPAGGYGLHSHE